MVYPQSLASFQVSKQVLENKSLGKYLKVYLSVCEDFPKDTEFNNLQFQLTQYARVRKIKLIVATLPDVAIDAFKKLGYIKPGNWSNYMFRIS